MSGRQRKKATVSKGGLEETTVLDLTLEDNSETRPTSKKMKMNLNIEANPYELIEQIPTVELSRSEMQGDPVELIIKLQ